MGTLLHHTSNNTNNSIEQQNNSTDLSILMPLFNSPAISFQHDNQYETSEEHAYRSNDSNSFLLTLIPQCSYDNWINREEFLSHVKYVMARDRVTLSDMTIYMQLSCSTLCTLLANKYKYTNDRHINLLSAWATHQDEILIRQVNRVMAAEGLDLTNAASQFGTTTEEFADWLLLLDGLENRRVMDEKVLQWIYKVTGVNRSQLLGNTRKKTHQANQLLHQIVQLNEQLSERMSTNENIAGLIEL
jgi:hypothetical protein